MKSKIIVIDGMDGTGKATQSKLLYKDLLNRGMKVKLFSFPNYDADSSYFVKKYLKEGYTRDIEDPMLHSMYFSIDRAITYNKEIKNYYEDGYIIIMDRYIISNPICQIHNYSDKSDIVKYLNELTEIENRILKLPKADSNIILYAEPEVSSKLMDSRYSNTDSKRDLNENLDLQRKFYSNIFTMCNIPMAEQVLGPIRTMQIHSNDAYNNEPILFTEEEMSFSILKFINDKFGLYLDIK